MHGGLESDLPQTAVRAKVSWRSWLPLLFVLTVTVLAAGRMFMLVNRYAVNIFFWDQWDFNNATLFEKHSLWQMFTWQHGPHRQGLGALVSFIFEPLFRWNSRGEAFLACAIFVAAALLALDLKRRLYGPFTYSDAAIPLIFLIPTEYESLFGATNLSHGPLPILLLVVYCIGWTEKRVWVRYAWVLISNFLLIYTGFGLFVGVITPFLLILDYVGQKRSGAAELKLSGFVLVLFFSAASVLSFFIGYKYYPAAPCFHPFSEPLVHYLQFVTVMFSNFIGLNQVWWLPGLASGVVMLWACIALVAALVATVANRQQTRTQGIVATALLVFTLLFCGNAALGRLCLGMVMAMNSRYVPYLTPAFLGLYFFCLSQRIRRTRAFSIVAFVAIAINASVPIRIGDRSMMAQFHDLKSNWRNCYLERHDIQGCEAMLKARKPPEYRIYPSPSVTSLQEKLDYLERNKLNLYATRD